MRIDNEIVTATCVNAMEGKDVNGGTPPVTDIKYSPSRNDAVNANGILSPPTTPSTTTPSESEYASSASGSGRFKFFKDGKFILELWHHKNHWIPVTKNSTTFWLPTGHCTPRQESSTSLSVSDDNSSIQSSPWQRDHCWKQNVPRKNVNRELEFMMRCLRPRNRRFTSTAIRRRRRRPHDPIKLEACDKLETKESKDDVDGIEHSVNTNRKQTTSNFSLHTRKLSEIVLKLMERRTYESATSSCRTDPGIVSPRKRILKEMERVSLEEMNSTNKKHRARTATSNASGSIVTVATGTICGPATTTATFTATTATIAPVKSTSSHSISSILARYEEPSFLRNLLKSPTDMSTAASGPAESRSSTTTSAVDAVASGGELRIPRPSHCSTPVKSSHSPPHPSSKSLHCPQPIPPYISPAYLYPPVQSFLASPPISNHPPYYSTPFPPPHAFHDSSVWSMPSVSSPYRQSVLSSSNVSAYPPLNPAPWIPVAHSSLSTYSAMNENGTDGPLNLSKH